MNALTRLERLDDMFPELFRRLGRPLQLSTDGPGDIRIDVTENDKDYQVRAEIPGAKKEDIRVSVDGNYVSISAEVKKEKEEKKDGRVLRSERQYGFASRSFALATDVDDTKADAKFNNGVLELKLPKRAGGGHKRLTVS